MKKKIFVDGQEGTTGLMINKRLKTRNDINILEIKHEQRKNINARKKLINESDITFLCLPDNAAIESVNLVENKNTKLIDASTAHRTDPSWTYGLPELENTQRSKIQKSNKITNPGCHATGFITLIYPLIKNKIIDNTYPVTCTSLTGYSGGGKKLISKFENNELENTNSPKHYALNLKHKHLKEMTKISGLKYSPIFNPIIGNYYKGMVVSIPLYMNLLNKIIKPKDLHELFSEYYNNEYFINIKPFEDKENLENGFLNTEKNNDTNNLDIFVYGNEEQSILLARFDNLGKGASGAAIQNMNILLGVDEKTGLLPI